jgi:hypothetical protein
MDINHRINQNRGSRDLLFILFFSFVFEIKRCTILSGIGKNFDWANYCQLVLKPDNPCELDVLFLGLVLVNLDLRFGPELQITTCNL